MTFITNTLLWLLCVPSACPINNCTKNWHTNETEVKFVTDYVGGNHYTLLFLKLWPRTLLIFVSLTCRYFPPCFLMLHCWSRLQYSVVHSSTQCVHATADGDSEKGQHQNSQRHDFYIYGVSSIRSWPRCSRPPKSSFSWEPAVVGEGTSSQITLQSAGTLKGKPTLTNWQRAKLLLWQRPLSSNSQKCCATRLG